MKAVFVLLLVLPAVFCFYMRPNNHYFPARITGRNTPAVYKSLGDFFHRLHLASIASSTASLNNNNPGKRCANTFDEGCSNGDINGAGSDDDWLHGDDNPGRR